MKKIFSLFLLISALISFSCSDNATGPTTGGALGGGGTGGGGGAVTFTVTLDQQNSQFVFTPNTNVVISTITANCPAANVNNEQVQGDGTTVWSNNNPAGVTVPANILAQGQVWTFTIVGKIGTSTGAAYTSTATHTVQ